MQLMRRRLADPNLLLFLLTIELIFVCGFVPNGGWRPRIPWMRIGKARLVSFDPQQDPPLLRAPPALVATPVDRMGAGPPGAGGAPSIAAFFSECTGCSAGAVRLLAEAAVQSPSVRVHAVYPEDPALIRREFELHTPPIVVWASCSEATMRAWNAVWTPRIYAVDGLGRLVYAQPFGEDFAIALRRAEEACAGPQGVGH